MKKNVLLFVLFFTCAMTLHAQDRVAVFNPTMHTETLTANEIVDIRKEIEAVLGSNNATYQLLAREQIEIIVEEVIGGHELIYSDSTRIQLGRLLAAQKLIFTEVTAHSSNGFHIYCEQVDVATGVIDKQGYGRIEYRKYLSLAAKEAASVFAKDPISVQRDVKKEKEAIEKTIKEMEKDMKKKPKTEWNPFRLKMPFQTFGLSVEYIQRERVLKDVETGTIVNYDYWGKESMSGVQLGFRYDKYFAPKVFGLGIHSGLSVGYYFQKSRPSAEANENLAFEELALSIPLQGIYRLDFSKHIGCYISCGVSVDIGLYSRVRMSGDNTNEVYTNIYDDEEWGNIPRFNYSLTYGAGVHIDRMMLGVSVAKGLSNQSNDLSYEIFQNRKIQATLTIMF